MRRAAKVDSNHAEVLGAARDVGAAVLDLHALPGALDALIGFRSRLFLVEIKDGKKVKSARKLTPAEVETISLFTRCDCPVLVVENADQLLRSIGAIL
jgi:hypothetical protein